MTLRLFAAGLLDDLDTVGLVLSELLEALHQGVGDGHAGELGIVATVGSGLGVTSVRYVSKRLPAWERKKAPHTLVGKQESNPS